MYLINRVPLLIGTTMTGVHVDVLIIEIVIHALVIMPRFEGACSIGRIVRPLVSHPRLQQQQSIIRLESQRHAKRTSS